MKKLLIIGMIGLTISSAQAHGPHGGYHHGHYGSGWGWVVPAVIGGTIVYAATRPTIVAQPPVIIQPQVAPPAPIGYHYEQVLDANCNCYKLVLIPN